MPRLIDIANPAFLPRALSASIFALLAAWLLWDASIPSPRSALDEPAYVASVLPQGTGYRSSALLISQSGKIARCSGKTSGHAAAFSRSPTSLCPIPALLALQGNPRPLRMIHLDGKILALYDPDGAPLITRSDWESPRNLLWLISSIFAAMAFGALLHRD